MRDIYRELMRRSIEDATDVAADAEAEVQNVDQFALELFRFRVIQQQSNINTSPAPDWRDRQ